MVPAIEQSAGIRQLHAFKTGGVVVFCRVDLLLPSMFCLRLAMQQ